MKEKSHKTSKKCRTTIALSPNAWCFMLKQTGQPTSEYKTISEFIESILHMAAYQLEDELLEQSIQRWNATLREVKIAALDKPQEQKLQASVSIDERAYKALNSMFELNPLFQTKSEAVDTLIHQMEKDTKTTRGKHVYYQFIKL